MQHRARGIDFDTAVFTNLTQDHLDYHKTMEQYFEAKTALFAGLAGQRKKKGRAVINIDDRYGHRLSERFKRKLPVITYGQRVGSDFRASDVHFDATGSATDSRRRGEAISSGSLSARSISTIPSPPCRRRFNGDGSARRRRRDRQCPAGSRPPGTRPRQAQLPGLCGLRAHRGRLAQCAADAERAQADPSHRRLRMRRRSRRAKRPLMAAVSEEAADWSILTSDNPRTEDPAKILSEMRAGLRANRHEEIPDRTEAIRKAIKLAAAGDIVLIAGKGHETYQEFADKKIPFNDSAVARRAIEERRVEIEEDDDSGRAHDATPAVLSAVIETLEGALIVDALTLSEIADMCGGVLHAASPSQTVRRISKDTRALSGDLYSPFTAKTTTAISMQGMPRPKEQPARF